MTRRGAIPFVLIALTSAAGAQAQDDKLLTGEAAWPSVARIEHYSGDVGMYGYEIHNYDGANMAFVIHQYSALAPAFQIDNTKHSPFIVLRNAENKTTSPGTRGAGAFMVFAGYGKTKPDESITLGWLGPDLDFHSSDPKLPFKFFDGLSLAGEVKIDGRSGVSCKGFNPATFEVIKGIVVHC